MEGKRSYFLSDIHLGAGYITDPRAHQARVVAFLESIAADASDIYFLGDVLDYWFEYRTVVPRGYVRFFGALARLADSGVRIHWFTGNHDIWLFDYLRDEIGIEICDPSEGGEFVTIDGTLFYLGHGDGMGTQPLGFRIMRSLFRNRLCQKLFSCIHPRWTVPFAHRWSSHSRKASTPVEELSGADRARLELFARTLAKENPQLRYIVMGHYHVVVDVPVTSRTHMVILGDWIRRSTYAVFDGKKLELKEFCY